MRPEIKNALGLIGCMCLVALFAALLCLAGLLHSADRAAQEIVPTVDRHLTDIQGIADVRLRSIEEKADAQLTALNKTVDRTHTDALDLTAGAVVLIHKDLQAALDIVDQRTGEALAIAKPVALGLEDVEWKAAGTIAAIRPTIDNLNELSGPILRNSLGTIAAAKVAMGDVAKAGRTFEATSLSLDQAAKNSAEASKQSAILAQNLAKATKPLPTWLRIGLAVAPSAAQTAFPLWSMFAK